MPRQTPAELRAEIVDRAASLFARQGFASTSLQQIADAVSYSKAGLLHHFPTKEAIYRAALVTVREQVNALAAFASSTTPGVERDRHLVILTVDLTYAWPGVSLLSISLSDQDDAADPELAQAAAVMTGLFGLDEHSSDERVARVLTATTGLTWAAICAVRADMKREWRDPIISAAMNALGHTG